MVNKYSELMFIWVYSTVYGRQRDGWQRRKTEGIVERVKINILRWHGHIRRSKEGYYQNICSVHGTFDGTDSPHPGNE